MVCNAQPLNCNKKSITIWNVMPWKVLDKCQRFKDACHIHIQIGKQKIDSAGLCWTWLPIHQTTRRHNQGDSNRYIHRREEQEAAVTELTPQLQVYIPNTKFNRNRFDSFVRRPCRWTRRCSQFPLYICISCDFFKLRKNYTLCYLKSRGKLWTLSTKGLSIDPLSINGTVRQLVQSGRAQHEVRNVVCREPTQLTEFVFTNARVPPHKEISFPLPFAPTEVCRPKLQTETCSCRL